MSLDLSVHMVEGAKTGRSHLVTQNDTTEISFIEYIFLNTGF